jgi:hypothetical protein
MNFVTSLIYNDLRRAVPLVLIITIAKLHDLFDYKT